MNKKKWSLLILCILLLAGYLKLFYKTWSNEGVPGNADCIIAIDVKRITNTMIWDFITTPSQWKASSIFSSSKEDKISWDDMVELPDYVFVFHTANQPANAWYTALKVNDSDDFEKGLQQFHFEKRGNNEYFSTATGIEFIRQGNLLLAGNAAVENKQFIRQIAAELFSRKEYIAREKLEKNISAASHLSVLVSKNSFLQEDAVITANFDKTKIVADAFFFPQEQYRFNENNFSYSDSSLFSMAFTQPAPALYALLTDSARSGISRAVNFNIDSLLLPGNTAYQLDAAAIIPRVDSAVSYTYDDNFNAIEKVVVNNVEEPAFNFTVHGNDAGKVYDYWSSTGKLEKTVTGDWFTPLPFVKSYCTKKSEQDIALTSNNYKSSPANNTANCILLLNVLLTKIPSSLLKYLPDDAVKMISNLESVKLIVQKEKGQIALHVSFNKRKNDLPILQW